MARALGGADVDEVLQRLESAKAGAINDAEIWEDIRLLLDGESLAVCTKHLFRIFRLAMTEGGMKVDHFPLFDFVLDQVASALALRPEIRPSDGGEELAALWRYWWTTKALQQADRLRCAAGYAVLHLRLTDDTAAEPKKAVDLEVLRGDQVEVDPDPMYPRDWSRVRSVTIHGTDGDVIYTRQDDGGYFGSRKTQKEVEDLGIWDACPVIGWYYRPSSRLLPTPYSTLRDAHVMVSRHMSKASHDFVYRLNQPWAKNLPIAGKQVRFGAHLLLDLGEDGLVGSLQTQDTYGSGVDGLIKALKLVVRLYGLPPEFLDTVNRSETGAARSWDDRALTDLLRQRRTAIDADVEATNAQWAPLLPPGSITFQCTEPPPPVPVDRATEVNGIKAEMSIGLTTPAVELARRKQIPVVKAQSMVDDALRRNRSAFPELFGGTNGQDPSQN